MSRLVVLHRVRPLKLSPSSWFGTSWWTSKVEKVGASYKARWLLPNKEFIEMKLKEGFR